MDIRTLLVCTLLVQVCCGLGLYLVARTVSGFSSLRWWSGAYLLLSGAFLLAMNGFFLPGRLFSLAAAVFLTQGVVDHFAPRIRVLRRGTILIALFFLLALLARQLPVATPFAPDVAQILFSLAFAAALLPGAWLALSHTADNDRTPRIVLGSLLATIGLIVLARGIVAPLRGAVVDPWTNDSARFAGLALYLMAFSALAFVFVWVVAARMRRQFETESLTDALTGVLNRRALDAVMTRECGKRQGGDTTAMALLAIDMDEFKAVNDTYGHPAGDCLLTAAAQAMASVLRTGDCLARFGGEEFVVVLPGRGLDQAAVIAERLRASLADLSVACEGHQLRATASIGVAAWQPGETAFEVLGRADRNLYAAKRAGRNRVSLGDWSISAGAGR